MRTHAARGSTSSQLLLIALMVLVGVTLLLTLRAPTEATVQIVPSSVEAGVEASLRVVSGGGGGLAARAGRAESDPLLFLLRFLTWGA